MGREIHTTEFTAEDRIRFRDKLKAGLSALARMVEEGRLAGGRPVMGIELELYLTDEDGRPAPVNAELLERLPEGTLQTELARFNAELDLAPRELAGGAFHDAESDLRRLLAQVDREAHALGAQVLTVGILPTLDAEDLTEDNLSADPRYKALNDAILAARGEHIQVRIEGEDTLVATTSSIVFEAACTSFQVHLDTASEDFARYWNAAQALAGPLVAVAANSPFFLGSALHHETRIALFEQSIDTRTEELEAQGVRPRVWFGEQWLRGGVLELFEENVRFFPALLPVCDEEDPFAVLASGRTPELPELALHNGTIYRWNRPVYSVVGGRPQVRIENRVLPAGPTVVDGLANAAFFFGLVRALADARPPVWEAMSFATAQANFFAAARAGLEAGITWPEVGERVPAAELLVDHLLPLAHDGLRAWGIDDADRRRLLGILRERAASGQNGAAWQRETHRALRSEHGLGRIEAAVEVVRRYRKQALTGEPVHTWPR